MPASRATTPKGSCLFAFTQLVPFSPLHIDIVLESPSNLVKTSYMPPRKSVEDVEANAAGSGAKRKQSNMRTFFISIFCSLLYALIMLVSTLGGTRSLKNGGRLAALLKMPIEIFTEVRSQTLRLCSTSLYFFPDRLLYVSRGSFKSFAVIPRTSRSTDVQVLETRVGSSAGNTRNSAMSLGPERASIRRLAFWKRM